MHHPILPFLGVAALAVGACGPNVDGAERLENAWPGIYVVGTAPSDFRGNQDLRVLDFRDDGTMTIFILKCNASRTGGLELEWRPEGGEVVEMLHASTELGFEPGTLYERIDVENPPCGPHPRDNAQTGYQTPLIAGRYCPENVTTEGQGFLRCDFVPCDERARMCAEELDDGN